MDDDGDYSESRALVILDQHAEREKTGPYHERRRVRRRVTAVLMSSSFDRLALVALGASAVSPFVVVVLSEVKDPSPTTPAADCRRRDCIPILSPAALSVLNRDGLVILDAGLPADVIASARADALNLLHDNAMSGDTGTTAAVRRDLTTWIEAAGLGTATSDRDALAACATLLRGLAWELDEGSAVYSRSRSHRAPTELQLSCFDGGKAFYRAHRDAPSVGPSSSVWALGVMGWLSARAYRRRCVTAILYLNESDWNSDEAHDGGALRAYIGAQDSDETGESAKRVLSISPTGGTLVVFDSQEILHEVLPSNRQRFALTCWLCGDYTAAPPPSSSPSPLLR